MANTRRPSHIAKPGTIHEAAESGNLQELQARIAEFIGNDKYKTGRTAAQTREELLEMTPLHIASENGRVEVVEYLVGLGVDVNVEDNAKTSPLHLASINNHTRVMELLIRNGASVNKKDTEGDTPLHWAATKGHLQAIEVLLLHGANIEAGNNKGWTPLHRAAYNGRSDACQKLLQKEASLHTVTHDGNTAVHLATMAFQLGTMDTLLQAGARTDLANEDGKVPLDLCNHEASRDIITSAAAARGQKNPLRTAFIRSKIDPTAVEKADTPSAPASRTPSFTPAVPVTPAVTQQRKPTGFGFPLEEESSAPDTSLQINADATDDPKSTSMFSYISSLETPSRPSSRQNLSATESRPATSSSTSGTSSEIKGSRPPTPRPVEAIAAGRPSSTRKVVEALRSHSGGAGEVGPWEQSGRGGAGGNLGQVDDFQEAVRVQNRLAAAAAAESSLLAPPPRKDSANKKFLERYDLMRLNLFAP